MRNRIILMILVVFFAECSIKKASMPADKPAPPKGKPILAERSGHAFTEFASSVGYSRTENQKSKMADMEPSTPC